MRALARFGLAAFCWMTAGYAFVASSAFAYLQFLQPRVFAWVGQFSDWHRSASFVWLAILIAFVWSDLRSPDKDARRPIAAAGLAMSTVLCLLNLAYSVLPGLSAGAVSIAVGVFSLAPVMWLAVLDHVRGVSYLRAQTARRDEAQLRARENRMLLTAVATAVWLTVLYAVLTSLRLAGTFEPDLLTAGLAAGFVVSLAEHLAIFMVPFLVVALILRGTNGSFGVQYGMLAFALVLLVAGAFDRLVGIVLSFHGASGAIAALAASLSIVGLCSGARLSTLAERNVPSDSPLDLFFGSAGTKVGGLELFAKVAAVALLACGALAVSTRVDWDFTILTIGVLASWFCALSVTHRARWRAIRLGSWGTAAFCLAPLVVIGASGDNASAREVLNRYAVYNPSFRVAEAILPGAGSKHSGFDKYLQAHTGLTDVAVAPIDIDFARRLTRAEGQKPLLFLFVIDSLRPDYLGTYNPSVRFTPRITEFASESTVFRNAFTAFGGTGLSVPAIWAGASVVHKQYPKPFHPMNALEKLLDANDYRRMVGLDSIAAQLLEPSALLEELDRGRTGMDFEFCRTLDELGEKLETTSGLTEPVFAYSLPQDIHMSRLPRTVESGKEFQAFYAPYATKVHALDACFGRFIDRLKRLRLYDRSLIVLTSDHGEMLGEDGRFGHSYHLFPQVTQIPLIVHFPSWIDQRAIDPDALSRSVDIVPTMYAVLGYRTQSGALMGRPLIGIDEQQSANRRRDTYVIAASYGAVYATLRHNGRRLYIADAIRGGDQAFERDAAGRWAQAEVSEGLRAVNQFAIRRHVDEIARTYHLGEPYDGRP